MQGDGGIDDAIEKESPLYLGDATLLSKKIYLYFSHPTKVTINRYDWNKRRKAQWFVQRAAQRP
jgi:hypothetical protein